MYRREDRGAGGKVSAILVHFWCCQATLDLLVKSLYAREIQVGQEDVVEILLTADYLQASISSVFSAYLSPFIC